MSSLPWWVPLLQSVIQALGVVGAASIGLLLWRRQVRQEQEKITARMTAESNAAEESRRMRTRDILIGLRAEIAMDVERLEPIFGDDYVAQVRGRFVANLQETRPAKDRKDMPQAPAAEVHFVFDIIKNDLMIIPETTIEPIIRYYRHSRFLDAMTHAFSNGMFEGLTDERQIAAVDQYLDLGRRALSYGKAARDKVNEFIKNGHADVPAPADVIKPG